MTNLSDLDRALAEFLEDGPNAVPEAPIIAALAHARTTPRRPDPLSRLRRDVMAAPWRPFGLRLVLAFALVGLLAAGIGVAVLGSRPPVQPAVTIPSATAQPSTHLSGPPETPVPSVPPPFAGDVTMLVSAGRPFRIQVTGMSGALVAARSVQPGDGASVDETTVQVKADPADPKSLIVTWLGVPCETGGFLRVDEAAHEVDVDRQTCQGDALPLDRIVRLTFDGPVTAADWSGRVFALPTGPGASA